MTAEEFDDFEDWSCFGHEPEEKKLDAEEDLGENELDHEVCGWGCSYEDKLMRELQRSEESLRAIEDFRRRLETNGLGYVRAYPVTA